MATSRVVYQGELRTSAQHLKSDKEIISDAPTDNNGKGEAFSPTDLLASSLASCMITIMGIRCRQHSIPEPSMEAEVTKTMAADPRRVSKVEITLHMKGALSDDQKAFLEQEGRACPVAKSLHPDLAQEITFVWG